MKYQQSFEQTCNNFFFSHSMCQCLSDSVSDESGKLALSSLRNQGALDCLLGSRLEKMQSIYNNILIHYSC